MAKPNINFNTVLAALKKSRERIVIVVLLIIAFGVARRDFDLNRQISDSEGQNAIINQVLTDAGYAQAVAPGPGKVESKKINYAKVKDNMMNVPDQEHIVQPIVARAPFSRRDDVQKTRVRVNDLIVDAESRMAERNYAGAIEIWTEIDGLDPQHVFSDYATGSPQERINECRLSQTREQIEKDRNTADLYYKEGTTFLQAGNKTSAKDNLMNALKIYQRMLDQDKDRTIKAGVYYEEIDKIIAELRTVVEGLIRDTLNEEVLTKLADANKEFDAYKSDTTSLGSLASARRFVEEILNKLTLEDPEGKYAQQDKVKDAKDLYTSICEAVDAVTPNLDAQVADLTKSDTTRSDREVIANYGKAIDLVGTLAGLNPSNTSYRTTLTELQTKQSDLERSDNLAQAQTLYSEASDLYNKAEEARTKGDSAQAEAFKAEGMTRLDRIATDFPAEHVEPLTVSVRDLRKRFDILIEAKPEIKAVLEGFGDDGRSAIISSGTRKNVLHRLDEKNSFTRLILKEIDPSSDPQWVKVARDGYSDTTLFLKR